MIVRMQNARYFHMFLQLKLNKSEKTYCAIQSSIWKCAFTGPNKVLLVFGQRTSAHREDCTMLKCMYVLCTNNLFCMINATRSFTEIYIHQCLIEWLFVSGELVFLKSCLNFLHQLLFSIFYYHRKFVSINI